MKDERIGKDVHKILMWRGVADQGAKIAGTGRSSLVLLEVNVYVGVKRADVVARDCHWKLHLDRGRGHSHR